MRFPTMWYVPPAKAQTCLRMKNYPACKEFEFAYKNRQIGMELISSGNVSDFSYICDIYSEMGRYTTGNYRIYKWTFNFNPYCANQNCSRRQILWHLSKFLTKIRNDISWESSASRRFSWNIMPYSLFLKILNCCLLQNTGGALRVNSLHAG